MVRGVPPFPFVRESLEKLSGKADMLVVSATPQEALQTEWEEHDIAQYAAAICGQELGTKKEMLANASQYPLQHTLMVGDAPGDYRQLPRTIACSSPSTRVKRTKAGGDCSRRVWIASWMDDLLAIISANCWRNSTATCPKNRLGPSMTRTHDKNSTSQLFCGGATMRTCVSFVALGLLACHAAAMAADEDGFVTLFNGKDLAGWKMAPTSRWVVEDGAITLARQEDGQEHNLDYLWTDEAYGDFVLELECKVPEQANSGIFLRTADLKDPVYTGIEIQVCNSYGIEHWGKGNCSGAIYDCVVPAKNTMDKPGQWNHFRIMCQGSRITVALNGQQIAEMDLDQWTEPHKNPDGTKNKFPVALKDFVRSGHIGLQDHGRRVWYRNIRVKRLANESYSLLPDENGMVLRTPNGRMVLRDMTVKPEKSNLLANSVCCFHPLNTPSGRRLTDLAPGDHHHHRGVFLAWHTAEFWEKADFSGQGPTAPPYGWNIYRGDFWGWGQYAPTEGVVIKNRGVQLVASDRDHAEIGVQNAWMIGQRVLMNEDLRATVREQNGSFVVDLAYDLVPVVDLLLNQTAFGGFCLRARNDGESWYSGPDGKIDLPDPHYSAPELNWPASPWCDYTIKLEDGATIGCTVIEHPGNPLATWHNPRYIWMINPCIVDRAPVKVNQAESLKLQYRLVVHDGPLPTDLVRQLASQWRGRDLN